MSEVNIQKPGILQSLKLALYRKLDLVGDQRLLIGDTGLPERTAPSPLKALFRFIPARLEAKKRSAPLITSDVFRADVDTTLNAVSDEVAGCDWFMIKPNTEDWQATGIQAEPGDEFTLLASGMLYLFKALDVGIGPGVGLWYRFADGKVHKLTRASQVIRADVAGELRLIASIPGEFADPHGAFETSVPRKPMEGEYAVAVIRWAQSTRDGLAAAVAVNADLLQPVLDDYEHPAVPPEGWKYLWKIGNAEVFQACEHEDGSAICCHAKEDAGILQYPVDIALSPDTRLQWSWLMEQLPSKLPEHIQPTHDYLSIAIEFDNGLDLTYMWSAELPVDTIFQCPLPWWDQRETHWVLRNDPAEMGRWLDEGRDVYEDYHRSISGQRPERVVAVWLIANAAFQRGQGDCRYRAIKVSGGGKEVVVHP